MIKHLLTAIFTSFLFHFTGFSQSIDPIAIASGGSFFDDGEHNLSVTVGELIIETFGDGEHFITQGFQQPTPYVIVSVPNQPKLLSEIKVFPNPFSNNLSISINSPEEKRYEIHLYNIQGKLMTPPIIAEQGLGNYTYELNASQLSPGFYFVRISEIGGNAYKDFKLIKS